MHNPQSKSFFRGGGLICSSQVPQESNFLDESFINYEMIKSFFFDLDGLCQDINEQSKSIQSEECQEKILKIIRSIQYQSQFINQTSRNYIKTREYIRQVLENIEILLDSITNTIVSSRFIALQILKVCNQLSRLIFQYYAHDQSIPLDLDRQQSILSVITQIQTLLNQGGEQLYYNSICYEIYIIQICIEICPTNSEESKEVLLAIISGIQASLEELSTDLLSALAQGGLFVYKQIKQRKQRNIFQIIFYLEEFKFRIIEKIQQGQGINKIIKQLANNYNLLVKNSTEWLIKCSWIKLMSDLIIYKPVITLKQFQIIKAMNQLTNEWDTLVQKKIISLVEQKKQIGIILQNDENSNINRILQQQVIKFQYLQNCIINGDRQLPKIEQLKEFQQQQQKITNEQTNLIIQELQNLPIEQFLHQLTQYSQQIIKRLEVVQDFQEDIDNQANNQQYLLTQIEHIISENDNLDNFWFQLKQNNNILLDFLENIVQQLVQKEISKKSQINLVLNQVISYFELQKLLEIKQDDLESKYQSLLNQLQITYEFNEQTQQLLQIIKNGLSFASLDTLIIQLQEFNTKYKFVCTLDDIYYQINIINVIIKQITQTRESLISLKMDFINIKSFLIANIFDWVKLRQFCQKQDYFKISCTQYSFIISLNFIYTQINQNQQLLISNILLIQKQEFSIGVNLSALQVNHRLQDVLLSLSIIGQQQSNQFAQLNNLDDRIQYLTFLQQVYIYTDMKINQEISNLKNLIMSVDSLYTEQDSENQNSIIIDQIIANYHQLSQEIDSELFIEYIQKRINLLIQLQQYQIGDQNTVMNDLEILSLIIEDLQQKYSNISKEDVLQTLKIQQDKIINLQLNFKEQSVTNRDKSSILNLKIYFLSLKQIIEQLNIYKFKDNQNNITHEINSMINYLKLQKHLKNQLDENYCHKYNQIQDSFQQIYHLDLDKHQQEIQQQFLLLQQQDVKLSIDQVKDLIPSYQQLINIVIDTNTNQLSIKQKAIQFLNDAITSDEWRIKDYLYFNCFVIHKSLNESNQKIVGNLLLMARFQEIDHRVINTLKGKEQIIQMEEIINNQWEETQDQVVNQLQLTLNELQAVQLSLQSEERKEIRNQLLTKHKTLEQQLEQQMKNVDQIGDIIGITIYFLKDIKRDLQLIQSKLDNIINSIEQIGQDIKFLRGKTPQQILEIRMQNVLQNKIYSDAQSVYVQMKTLEFDFLLNQDKSEQTPLFNSDSFENGEIDEFLKENTKSSLLIHGAAGSGKSLTARKIEEYLWLQYEKQIQNQKWDEVKGLSPLIPIFIQLPTLQDPKFNAIEETLLSSLYRFDQKQIELLRETAQQNKIRLSFIMDSYDELPQQYQGINLLQTNKIHLWKPQNQLQIPKVITTSRTEAFKTNDYRAWFWENEIQGTKSLKELRLLQFNDDQRQTYIEQFSILKLKIQLYDLLQVIDKTQEKDQIFLDVEDIWRNFQKTIQINISKGNRQFLLDKRDISIFINLIKSNQNIIAFNQELETSFTKIIQKLWHQNLYNSSIQQLNLSELLDNPFMLNIIIEVIPLMNSIVSKPNHIKQYFIANFLNNYSEFLEETVQNNQQQSTQQMSQEQIKYIHELLNNEIKLYEEVMQIWEQLINNNFFSSWSIQSTYDETIELLQNFKENLFRVPFLEDLLIILYKSLKSKKLTVFDFFETFIDQFVENQRQKLIYSSDIVDQNQFQQDIYQYAVKLAAQMFQRQETIIERKAQGILFRENSQDPYLQFFEDSDQFGNYRKQIRKCLPIRQKGNYFQFLHKSIQEFLFAKQQMDIFITSFAQINHIQKFINHYRLLDQQLNLDHIDFFDKKQNLGQDELKQQEILTNILMQLKDSILNQINLQDTFNLGTLKFMRAKFIQELNLYQILESFVLLSSINQSYLRFSSNCLIILLSVQQYQFNKDFSKIRISDISLDGAIFEQCNLSYSKFEKVSIKGISLNYSDISNCEWNQMYSYELPSIKIEGQNCFSWVSPKDNQLLTFTQNGPTDSQIQIWDYKEGEQIQSLKNPCVVYFAQYSNTGEFILSYGADQIIRLWSTASYTQIKEKQINEKFQRFTFSEDDQKIAFCSQNRVQIINNIENMQFSTIQLNECLGFTFEQNAIITLNYQNQSQISLIWWDTIKGTQLKKLSSVLIDPDKKLSVVIFNNGYIFISRISVIEKWDIKEFKQQGPQFKGHSGSITFMDVSKNGKLLVSCSWDKRIIVYDIKSCNALSTLLGHSQVINIVQFSPSSKFLISCSNDQEVRFWDLKFNESIQSQKIKDIQFSPDSKEVVCFSNNQIQFFSTKTSQQSNKLIEKIEIKCVALHPEGKYLLYSNENQIKTLDIRLLKQVGESKFTEKPILKLGYSSEGNKIFVALDPLPNEKQERGNLIQNQKIGGLVEIYNLNWELIHNYNCSPLKTITLSSNNEYLMDFYMTKKFRSAIQLFEFKTFQSKLIENDTEFNTFCLSDDSEQFIGLEYRNILKIWNLSDSKLIKKTQIQHFQISHLVQSSDKSFILCGTQKGYIIKFNLIADSIEKVFEDYQTEIDKIILSKNQLFFTAISKQPILILWQRVGQNDYYVSKYINPNRLSQNTLLFSTKLENVKITNHLDYDLGKLFQNRFKAQNALKLDQAQKRN